MYFFYLQNIWRTVKMAILGCEIDLDRTQDME